MPRPNSYLHEQLVNDISRHGNSEEAFRWLIAGIADRLEACKLNPVSTSDLLSILREDPTKLYNTVMRKG